VDAEAGTAVATGTVAARASAPAVKSERIVINRIINGN
jgi:hypothetical protein